MKQNLKNQNLVSKSELQQAINSIAYDLLSQLKAIRAKQQALDKQFAQLDEKLENFIDQIWDQIELGNEQGLNMNEISEQMAKVRELEKETRLEGEEFTRYNTI